jgi:hypothetical protein
LKAQYVSSGIPLITIIIIIIIIIIIDDQRYAARNMLSLQ